MNPRPGAIALMLLRAFLASPAGAQASAPPAGASLRGLSVAPDGTVWASGTGGTVLRSRDGGRSWVARSIPDAAALDLRDVEAVSATTAYAMVAGADTARIYRTSDGAGTGPGSTTIPVRASSSTASRSGTGRAGSRWATRWTGAS
jgi:hypothetical protein